MPERDFMGTAICPYYNGKLLQNSISLTTSTQERMILKMVAKEGYVIAVKKIEYGLGKFRSRMYRTPYKPYTIEHITRSPETEWEFKLIEFLQGFKPTQRGLTDIFKVHCEKDPVPHSDEFLIISDDVVEYSKGFFMLLDMNGGYESIQAIIDFYVGEGWTRTEIIDTIKKFLNFEYFMYEWHYATYFEKLRRVAAKDLHLLGLNALPELDSDKFNDVA